MVQDGILVAVLLVLQVDGHCCGSQAGGLGGIWGNEAASGPQFDALLAQEAPLNATSPVIGEMSPTFGKSL